MVRTDRQSGRVRMWLATMAWACAVAVAPARAAVPDLPDLEAIERAFVTLAEKVSPCVVSIRAARTIRSVHGEVALPDLPDEQAKELLDRPIWGAGST